MGNKKYVLYEKDQNIARIILNKPEKLNSYDLVGQGEDAKEIWASLDKAAEDDDIKVVIIKGEGPAFCTGQDLSKVGHGYGIGTGQAGERRPSQRIRLKLDRVRAIDQHLNRLFLHPKVTICQVHGYCCEGGAVIMCYCDLAIAAEDARIGFIGQRMGLAGNSHVLTTLIETVGLKRALRLMLTGKIIDGREAEKIGLVSMAVPPDRLEREVEEAAQAICLMPRDGIAIAKAARHMAYESLGITAGFTQAYVSHALFTNLRWEPDEYNFFKERREKGAKTAYKERDARYERVSPDII